MREHFAGRYKLRLTDVRTPPDLGEGEEFVGVDLRDIGAVQGVIEGVDAVVHLGGISSEDTWEAIRDVNIDGTYNVFESARRSGVKRVVYASSVHAVGFYPRSRKIGSEVTVLPDSRYGVSKAFGEALGALYANKYGLDLRVVARSSVDVLAQLASKGRLDAACAHAAVETGVTIPDCWWLCESAGIRRTALMN